MRLRVEQLEFRRLEVYEVFKAFRDIASGEETDVHLLNGGHIDGTSWRGRVNCNDGVVFAGHSFGGCTLLSTLSNPPPESHDPLPLSHAIALDPWFQPLSSPGPMPPSYSPSIPLCMLFSERFALWKDHHATAEALAKSWPAKATMFALRACFGVTRTGWIMTEVHLLTAKCTHEAFSDIYCIVPFAGRANGGIFETIAGVSRAFLEGRLDDELANRRTIPFKVITVKKKDSTRRLLEGQAGQIVIL
jgi:platelet-activating factor acetylhydrolase